MDVDFELSDHEENQRDLIEKFIELYKMSPELWNSKCREYTNKALRNKALDKLLEVYKKIKKDANREDVRKKINTLRSNFRRELKKIVNSKRSVSGTEDVYTPTAWTFFALSFLTPTILETSNKISGDGTEVQEGVNFGNYETSATQDVPTHSRSSIDDVQAQRIKKNRTVGPLAQQNELLQKACVLLETTDKPKNSVPPIVLAWGEKLSALEPQQKIFAEKAINDILFEATLGTLHRNSVKINESFTSNQTSYYHSTNSDISSHSASVHGTSPVSVTSP